MKTTVAVGQLAPTEDTQDNWRAAARLIEAASGQGAQLLILPEQTMLAQRAGDPARFAALASEAWAWWPNALADAARRFDIALVAGGFATLSDPARTVSDLASGLSRRLAAQSGSAPADSDPRPWNVLLAVNQRGVVTCQAKTRLYDAFNYRESDMVRPGRGPEYDPEPNPVDLAGVRFGLINCYELRFPELARGLIAAGAQALALGAAWTRGPLKEDQWGTLARARAIENCAYVLAAGTRAKDTIGRSMVISPGGVVIAGLADEAEGLAVTTIDTDCVLEARQRAGSMPLPTS
jgi:predicted amidohydrolase